MRACVRACVCVCVCVNLMYMYARARVWCVCVCLCVCVCVDGGGERAHNARVLMSVKDTSLSISVIKFHL